MTVLFFVFHPLWSHVSSISCQHVRFEGCQCLARSRVGSACEPLDSKKQNTNVAVHLRLEDLQGTDLFKNRQ